MISNSENMFQESSTTNHSFAAISACRERRQRTTSAKIIAEV
jgi:hypothetical protein